MKHYSVNKQLISDTVVGNFTINVQTDVSLLRPRHVQRSPFVTLLSDRTVIRHEWRRRLRACVQVQGQQFKHSL